MPGNDESRSDEVLNCLVFLAEHFGQTTSAPILRSGLAVDEAGCLPFHQVEPALELLGLKATPVTCKLARLSDKNLPAIISLQDGNAAVVLEKNEDEFLVCRPSANGM